MGKDAHATPDRAPLLFLFVFLLLFPSRRGQNEKDHEQEKEVRGVMRHLPLGSGTCAGCIR